MDDPIPKLPEKEQGEFLTIDGYPDVKKPCIFEKGIYFYLFYCLCYVKDISRDMFQEQVLEQIEPDLNEEEYIRMEDIREQHCRYVAEYVYDNINIHPLRWDVYTKDKEDLINRCFWVSVPYPKWWNIVWTFVKDYITGVKEDCEYIGLRGFDYKIF